ncbi:CNDH2 protein, partial [Dicrurus megarhynchus]|nr:CNDH2 protein [Dicrurus megarhynchus]
MDEGDSRFLHLLQPIRDLTKNWEVDVAAQLAEYLGELDQISISFDNGKTTMNFLEAAMLIQGSACVYSKKVEHLYMLVHQALDSIFKKKKEKLPSSLCLDSRDGRTALTGKPREALSPVPVPCRAVGAVRPTPMSVLPLDEAEKKKDPLLSRSGEVLGSRWDFQMNACTSHASGAFLLDTAKFSPADLQLEQQLGTATGSGGLWGGRVTVPVTASTSLSPSPGSSSSIRPHGAAEPWLRHGPGAAGPDDEDIPEALGDDMEVTVVPSEHIEAQRSSPRSRGYVLRERRPSQDPKAHSKEEPDPWQSLDPFGDSEEKPFRKGTPFLMPQGLEPVAGGKRKRRGPRKLQDFMGWFSAAYNNVPEGRKRRKGPTFAGEGDTGRDIARPGGHQGSCTGEGTEGTPKLTLSCTGEGHPKTDPVLHWGGHGGHPKTDPVLHWGGHGGHPKTDPVLHWGEPCPVRCPSLRAGADRWHSLTLPVPQESRAPFDVRAYGLALTEGCAGPGRWHSLASLVAGQPPFEVCRYLLASLQLANDGVVELAQDAGLEAALDTARLRPLSARPAHERFQSFQPPSQR